MSLTTRPKCVGVVMRRREERESRFHAFYRFLVYSFELTVYTQNSVPIWIPIGGGGNEFRWSGSDKPSSRENGGGLVDFKLSRRFPAAANFGVRPSNRLSSLQCLSLPSSCGTPLEMGSGNACYVCLEQGCQMAKFDPLLSLDCARVEGVGAQSKERKGSNFAA